MRMWGIDPKKLCQKHLLGEHMEMHMFVGTIKKGISIKGYINKGLVNPQLIYKRHNLIAKEMTRRGMNHMSPIAFDCSNLPSSPIAVKQNERQLKERCKKCEL